ncbi:hypothetical protein RFI_37256, partial [Reticulomyxa filosa]
SRCDIYRKSFAAEQKKKREEAVINPEINRYVLLRGVSIHESENEIKETLEDYGYQIQELKQFHKIPIVKVMLSNSSDVVKILKDNYIQIGYSMVKVERLIKMNPDQNRISSNAETATD